ncbi:MAG: PKD-like family lipoprotein [Pseudobacter sp.]|uniref:PKD-like family lipoprotein n=1 Tax=Pseudobacter sp. TaxID=2045420 RepID=UPI003F7D5968
MKQFINPWLILLLMTGVQSCYKDKGNYDLVDYNKIRTITTPTATPVILGDTLRVNPVITWKYPDRDTLAFEYEWRQVDSVVSRERNLRYAPDLSGYVMIYLYVKEKATGIVTRFAMQVQVVSPYKAGWLFLTNDGGKSGLSFVRRDAKKDANNVTYYEYKYIPDLYDNLYPNNPLGDNPQKLITRVFTDYSKDEVLVLQGNTPVFLNGDDFSKVLSLRNSFPGSVFPNGSHPVNFIDGGPVNFMHGSDGNIYWKRNSRMMGGVHDGLFIDLPIYFEGGGAHISELVEAAYDKSEIVYLYDDLNRRFIGLYTTSGDNSYVGGKMYLKDATGSTPPAGWVDLTNQAGYTLKYCGDYSNGLYYMNIIKNDVTGQYMMQNYRLTMKYTLIEVSEHQQEVFAGNGIVTDNTVYHRIFNSTYLFLGEGSKLYFYDVNTRQITLYHDFGTGKIKKIISDAVSGEIGVLLDNGRFSICSLKNDVLGSANPGQTGILYTVPNVGNVVDLAWKWGSYFEYTLRRYPG